MTQKKSRKKTLASVRCKLNFDDEESFIENYAPNISKTGIFAKTKKPKAVGDELKFEFQLADGTPVIRGKGEVTWNRRSESAAGAPAGMGIKFVSLDDAGKEIIDKVMEFKKSRGGEHNNPSMYSMIPPSEGYGDAENGSDAAPISLEEADSLLEELLSDTSSLSLPKRKRRKSLAAGAVYRPSEAPKRKTSFEPQVTAESALREPAVEEPAVDVSTMEDQAVPQQDPGEQEAEPQAAKPEIREENEPDRQDDASAPPENLLASSGDESGDDLSEEEIFDMLEVDPEDVQIEAVEIDADDIEEDEEEDDAQELSPDEVIAEPDIEISQEEVEGILEDVYSGDPAPSPPPSGQILGDNEFDDLLDALEEGDDEDAGDDDVQEIEDLDVVEIKE